MAAIVAATASGAAFAAHGHGNFGGRQGLRVGGNFFGQPGGGMFGMPGGGGGFVIAGHGEGMGPGHGGMMMGGGPGGPGGPGGGGILTADIITPAAAFLQITTTTLMADLAGGKTLAQEAVAKGKTAADLITAITANEKLVLDAEKAAGWITADQETSILNGFTDGVTRLVNNGPPVPHGGGGDRSGGPLELASAYLGISVTDLQTALKAGKTLASLVVAGKTTVDGLVAALEAPIKAKLDAAVTAGHITAAQETAILSDVTSHLTDMVNGTHTNAVKNNLKAFAKRH